MIFRCWETRRCLLAARLREDVDNVEARRSFSRSVDLARVLLLLLADVLLFAVSKCAVERNRSLLVFRPAANSREETWEQQEHRGEATAVNVRWSVSRWSRGLRSAISWTWTRAEVEERERGKRKKSRKRLCGWVKKKKKKKKKKEKEDRSWDP